MTYTIDSSGGLKLKSWSSVVNDTYRLVRVLCVVLDSRKMTLDEIAKLYTKWILGGFIC